MQIMLNGSPRELAAELTIAELLQQEQLGDKRVAVERNGDIVPRSRHASETIQAGDRIEIVHAIGGG
ncbi:MAG TPA: sulfur carrier protein ThiS [Permianibacter sp.]|nr:sulfur carrier protein ThiS [Permianibacter sp.]